ncbi:DNA polymerase-3 subunit epsilon [Actinopolyspora lacussalsi]|nr:DNA polymerase-3 subunit epsilon [Actinopolyspora lacussalsi]
MDDSGVCWADGPLLAFDLETTGVDTDTDRIVTATLISIVPGRDPVSSNWLADPGIEIPEESSEVHGITTEHARSHGRPAAAVVDELATTLSESWGPSTPLIAFNASFDLSVLHAELRRHHDRELPVAGPVVDPFCIDRQLDRYRKGKRTLGALCEHHGVRADGAHTSDGDALAAARLAWRLAKSYPERIGEVSLERLHDNQVGWYREQTRNFADYLDRQAGKASETAEAERLRQRAARVREDADSWPVRARPEPSTVAGA